MSTVYVCGPRRGRYGPPAPVDEAIKEWVSGATGRRVKPPRTLPCYRCCRLGRRRFRYPREEMYVQRWELSEEELLQAMEEYDFMSLDVPPRFLCRDCACEVSEGGNSGEDPDCENQGGITTSSPRSGRL